MGSAASKTSVEGKYVDMNDPNVIMVTEAALKRIKLQSSQQQDHEIESIATIQECQRRDMEKKRIQASFQRQLEIYQEQNTILQQHLTSLKLVQETSEVKTCRGDPMDKIPSTKEAKETLESCLRENSKQPLKCLSYVKTFVETVSAHVTQ